MNARTLVTAVLKDLGASFTNPPAVAPAPLSAGVTIFRVDLMGIVFPQVFSDFSTTASIS